jgi:hypothetical protein
MLCGVCKTPQAAHYRREGSEMLRCGPLEGDGYYWPWAERRRVALGFRRKFVEAYVIAHGCTANEASNKWDEIEADEDAWIEKWVPR